MIYELEKDEALIARDVAALVEKSRYCVNSDVGEDIKRYDALDIRNLERHYKSLQNLNKSRLVQLKSLKAEIALKNTDLISDI